MAHTFAWPRWRGNVSFLTKYILLLNRVSFACDSDNLKNKRFTLVIKGERNKMKHTLAVFGFKSVRNNYDCSRNKVISIFIISWKLISRFFVLNYRVRTHTHTHNHTQSNVYKFETVKIHIKSQYEYSFVVFTSAIINCCILLHSEL